MLLPTIGIILFFGVLAGYVLYRQTFSVLMELKRSELLRLTTEHALDTVQILNYGRKVVKQVASSKQVVDYMAGTPDPQNKTLLSELHKYNIASDFLAIYILDVTGVTMVSTDPSFVGKNYAFREYFTQAIQGEPYTDVAIGVTSGQLGHYFSTSIAKDGEIIGVAVAKMKPAVVHETFNVSPLAESDSQTEVYLVDRHGVIIHSSPEDDKLFHSLGEIRVSNYEQTMKDRYGGKQIEPLAYNELQQDLGSVNQITSYEIDDEKDGDKELLVLLPFSQYPFYFVSEVKLSPIVASANRIALTIAGFVGAAALAALLLISYLINKYLSPLTDLQRTVAAIASGDITKRAVKRTDDELGRLAESFNSMTDKLVDATTSVEKKVEERTTELQRLNDMMVGREQKMIELKKQIESLKKGGTS